MNHPLLSGWVVAALFLLAPAASARVIYVGPNGTVKTIADASRLAKDDDVVVIASGQYTGDVALWTQKRLTIRGEGQRPVLVAGGKSEEGKAIWVFRNGDFKVSNIEFRGARVDDQNGAGIRFENGKLTIVQCAFFDNQVGILTGNSADAELTIERSIFAQSPRQTASLPHLLYVGRIAALRITGSRFHGGYRGHLLKSRARVNDIRYNLLVDGDGGSASYEADFPNGGDVTLVGNVLGQSSTTENPTLVSFGSEGSTWPQSRLKMVHNTLYSKGWRPAWFLRVFKDKFTTAPEVMTRNNLLVGMGLFSMFVEGEHTGNHFALPSAMGDPAVMDFTLAAGSWLRGRVDPLIPDSAGLQPRFEQVLPGSVSGIRAPAKWAPGAVQTMTRQQR